MGFTASAGGSKGSVPNWNSYFVLFAGADVRKGEDEDLRPTSSSLSAVAPSFSPAPTRETRFDAPGDAPTTIAADAPLEALSESPFLAQLAAPPRDISTGDVYAQSGSVNDLFDDIAAPDESMRVRSDDDLFSDDFTPAPRPVVEQPALLPETGTRGDGARGRSRGRGRGRGGGGGSGQPRGSNGQAHEPGRSQSQAHPPEGAPTGPRKEPIASVKGDRQATGGLKKPKLTEEELADKMAQIQIKNASLTAAHARAEADAALFAQRESQAKQLAAQRQREERRDRQQMMGEREKNRMRKLKAIGGREWDAEKNEDDFGRGGQFDKKAGLPRDSQEYSDGREYLYKEPRGGLHNRSTGKGRHAGRAQEQKVPKQEDFPALTGASANTSEGMRADATPPSWADQVESSDV